MERQLCDYLPLFLHSVKELMEVTKSEQPEFNSLWEATGAVMNERYIDTATIYGVEHWETILQITPEAFETVDTRKARIKQRIGLTRPYTLPWLKTFLAAQFGDGKCSTWLDKYTLYIAVNPGINATDRVLSQLLESLCNIIPANIVLKDAFRFSKGLVVGKTFSHYLNDSIPQCGALICGTYP